MKRLLLAFLVVMFLAFPAYAVDVTIEWDANTEPDLAGYRVYKAEMITGTQTGPLEFVIELSSGVTTYTITDLDDHRVYAFQVYAFDTQGNVSNGSNFTFNLDRMAPSAVQNVR